MAHTYGGGGRIPAAGTTDSGNPVTASINLPAGTTVLWVSIVAGGTTARAGGSPTYNGVALTPSNAKTNAGGTPEVCAEDWYILNPSTGSALTLSIPNSGTLGLAVVYGYASAASGFTSVFDNKVATPGNSTNPSTSMTVSDGSIWFGAVGDGAQTWAPSGRSGTQIADWDAGSWGTGGQYGVKSGTGSQTISWTFGTSEDWIILGSSFKEQVIPEVNFLDDAESQALASRVRTNRGAGATGFSQFASFDLKSHAFENQSPQPPRRRFERGAAIASLSNINAVFVPPVQQPIVPGYLRHEFHARRVNRGSALEGRSAFAAFQLLGFGFANQPPQPPRQRREKTGAFARAVQIEGVFVAPPAGVTAAWGHEHRIELRQQRNKRGGVEGRSEFSFQPDRYWGFEAVTLAKRPRLTFAAMKGRASFAIFDQWRNFGFETAAAIRGPRRRDAFAVAAGRLDPVTAVAAQPYGGTLTVLPQPKARVARQTPLPGPVEAAYARFYPAGIDGTSAQGSLLRPRLRLGAIAPFPNIDAVFSPPIVIRWGLDQVPMLKPVRSRAAALEGRSPPLISFNLPPFSIDLAEDIRPRRRAAFDHLSVQIAPSAAPSVTAAWGHAFEGTVKRPRRTMGALKGRASFGYFSPFVSFDFENFRTFRQTRSRGSALEGRSAFASFGLLSFGFTIQLPQPRARPVRFGAVPSPVEAPYAPPVIIQREIAVPQTTLLRARQARAGGFAAFPNIEIVYRRWVNDGWQVQPVQPPKPRQERRAAVELGERAVQSGLIRFLPAGWAVQPYQPQHPRRERAGALMRGDDGTENVFSFIASPLIFGQDPPQIILRRILRRWLLSMPESGTAAPMVRQLLTAWTHDQALRRARSQMPGFGDPGIAGVLPSAVIFRQFEATAPLVRRPRRLLGAWASTPDAPFSQWRNRGWTPELPMLRQLRTAKNFGQPATFERAFPWVNLGHPQGEAMPKHPRFIIHPSQFADVFLRPPDIFLPATAWQTDGTMLRNPRRLFMPDFFGFRDFGYLRQHAARSSTIVASQFLRTVLEEQEVSTIIEALTSRTEIE